MSSVVNDMILGGLSNSQVQDVLLRKASEDCAAMGLNGGVQISVSGGSGVGTTVQQADASKEAFEKAKWAANRKSGSAV